MILDFWILEILKYNVTQNSIAKRDLILKRFLLANFIPTIGKKQIFNLD